MLLGCWTGNGTLEFNEFHDMMKTTLDGTTRWEKLKKAHTPPDTWRAFKVCVSSGSFEFLECLDTWLNDRKGI